MSIETLIHDWRLAVDDYAKAKAEAEYLKEFRKSKKAILMQEAQADPKKGLKTGQERETYAYAHTEYLELLDGLKVATKEAEQLRWRMTIAQERVNVWRTKQASARKEQGMYGA